MSEIIETTVYRLDELSGGAKDKARAWYRQGGFDYDWYDAVYEDFQRIAEILGLELKTRPIRLMGAASARTPASSSRVSGAGATGPVSRPFTATGNMHRA